MSPDERKNHAYIGDGVYAEFDGFGIWLRANDHRDHLCTDKIYIEPDILQSLNNFYQKMINE